jgi:hypothetical protein
MAVWYLDQEFHLDQEDSIEIISESDFSIDQVYQHNPFVDRELEMEHELTVDVIHDIPLDLMPLFPPKFHSSDILQDLCAEFGIQVGNWLTKTEDIVKLLGPNTVSSTTYIRYLGALIGVTFPPEDESTESELRKTLTDAIDWYKVKGTYDSINVIAAINQLSINIWDMYTNDYTTFYLVDWFVGDEDENPLGFDSTYYKSPHFGAEVVLDRVRVYGSQNYLWYEGLKDNFVRLVEETRPVHTVPHYMILLNPKTDERGNVITVSGDMDTKITSNWTVSQRFFDEATSGSWTFDSGIMVFDNSDEGFAKSITKWVLGTGNYGGDLSATDFDIESPALTGTIDVSDITFDADKITFEFIVPKATVQSDLTELGLYVGGTDTLVLASLFPKIDKTLGMELRVVVEVWKKDLSS